MEINSIREDNWRSRLVAVLQLATLREQDQQAGWHRWSYSINRGEASVCLRRNKPERQMEQMAF